MCDIDFGDPASVWDERLIGRARKEHACWTCGATISVGSSYFSCFYVADGDAYTEKQCIACRTIGDAFHREHGASLCPSSLFHYLVECLDEERWANDDPDDVDEDRGVTYDRLPTRLSDNGLRWKYAIAEIRARGVVYALAAAPEKTLS